MNMNSLGNKNKYLFIRFRRAEVEKLVVYIMDEPIDALSFMVRSGRAFDIGKNICIKLKDKIPPELFVVTIQAKIGGKVISQKYVYIYIYRLLLLREYLN